MRLMACGGCACISGGNENSDSICASTLAKIGARMVRVILSSEYVCVCLHDALLLLVEKTNIFVQLVVALGLCFRVCDKICYIVGGVNTIT